MYDCIIIGSGPSGLMAGITLKENSNSLIIEKNSSAGKKLLITGGGRCNLTNRKDNQTFLDIVNYNKKYLYSALYTFGPVEIYQFFESHNVPLKEEEDNKIFPVSNKSRDILNVLLNNNKIPIHYNETVLEIKENEVITNKNTYQCKNIIIATGGASFPVTGSTGDHMKFARKIKQPTIDLFPAETGLILNDTLDLAGTSLDNVCVIHQKKKYYGNLMFTHKGLSGSSIMALSEFIYKSNHKRIIIDLYPDLSKEQLLNNIELFCREKELISFLHHDFTKRFSEYLINRLNINKKVKSLTKTEKETIVYHLKNLEYTVKELEPIEKAYVTGGGIDLNCMDTTTMESKINKGIYFVGEALDIHGPIGGYNITLALSTGFLAGSSVLEKLERGE